MTSAVPIAVVGVADVRMVDVRGPRSAAWVTSAVLGAVATGFALAAALLDAATGFRLAASPT